MDLVKLEHYSLIAALLSYLTGGLFYIACLHFTNTSMKRIVTFVTLVGFLANVIFMVIRWNIGYGPFASGLEFLVGFVVSITGLYLLAEWRIKTRIFGAFILPISVLLCAYLVFFIPQQPADTEDPMKVFDNIWLVIHVFMALISYGAFTLAAGINLMYLIRRNGQKSESTNCFLTSLPPLDVLDNLSYKFIKLGYVLLTVVIVAGAISAESVLGTYWGWDPKETWSLITWLGYTSTLHARLTKGFWGNRAAFMSIISFLCVLMTLFGASSLFHGHHSFR